MFDFATMRYLFSSDDVKCVQEYSQLHILEAVSEFVS